MPYKRNILVNREGTGPTRYRKETTMQNVTFTESVLTARAHILNIREMYDIVADSMSYDTNPKNSMAAFGEMCVEFCAFADFDKFPEWAHVDCCVACAALEMIVKEWED